MLAAARQIMLPANGGRWGGRKLGHGGSGGCENRNQQPRRQSLGPQAAGAPAADAPLSPPPPSGRPNAHVLPSSPLDTLLPGFASRPNPSPQAAKRLRGRSGSIGHSTASGAQLPDGTTAAGAGKLPPLGSDCADACAAAGGGGFLASDLEAAGTLQVHGDEYVDHDSGGLAALLGLAPQRRHQGRTLLQQQLIAISEAQATQDAQHQLGAQQMAAGNPQTGPALRPVGPAPPAQLPPSRLGAAASAAAASHSAWAELAAEFGGSGAAAGQEAAGCPDGLQHLAQLPQQPRAGQQQAAAGGQHACHAGTEIPAGPAGTSTAAAATPALAVAPSSPAPLDLRLHRGELSRAEAAALDDLPLPAPLERLVRVFQVLAAWQGFLVRQHMAATWANSREHVAGLLPLVSAMLAALPQGMPAW